MIFTSRYQEKQAARRAEMTAKIAEHGLHLETLPGGQFRVVGDGIDVWTTDLAFLDHRDFETHR